MAGKEPFSLSRKSSSIVPSEDAEKTTPRQVKRRGCRRIHAVEFTVRTSYPAPPSLRASQRFDVHHLGFRKNPCAVLFRQVQVGDDPGCFSRRSGSPSCSRRRRCRWFARDLLRRRMDQGRSGCRVLPARAERCPLSCDRKYARIPQLQQRSSADGRRGRGSCFQ